MTTHNFKTNIHKHPQYKAASPKEVCPYAHRNNLTCILFRTKILRDLVNLSLFSHISSSLSLTYIQKKIGTCWSVRVCWDYKGKYIFPIIRRSQEWLLQATAILLKALMLDPKFYLQALFCKHPRY